MGIQIQANAVHQSELRDLFPASVLRELALVIDQTVNRAGGVDAVSSLFNTNKGRVSEWSNPDHPHWPNLRQIINLERFAKVDWITQAMAALHGADLVKRGSAEAHGAIISRLAVAAKEMGEALSSSAEAVAKPGCRSTVTTSVREVREAIRAAMELAAALEAQGAR